ncbi:DUF3667 domain-containing protein [Stenotrophomonas humi]
MHDNSRCINCERAVTGAAQKFCPDCGQPTPAHRIDWHFLGHELEHSVLHMDRGILYSLKQLMLHPGQLLRDYIEGRRGNQVKPLLLITVMSAVVVLLNRLVVGTGMMDINGGVDPAGALNASAESKAVMAAFMAASRSVTDWINAHFAAFTLMLLPMEASVKWLVFRRYGKLNYPEWLVITALLTVQVFVIWSVLILLQRWIPQTQLWAGLLGVIYGVCSLVQYFHGRSVWQTTWRALLAYAVFGVISSAMVGAATFALMLMK